jgi:predicted AlkP superfamily pyrophosphatase or phosphodiesterase
MLPRRPCWIALFFLVLLSHFGEPVARAAETVPAPEKPKLAVLIVFDQLRGDYLSRWNDLFCEEGFRRLEKDGAWFQNCHYPYAYTVTAAGHASLATGCPPNVHGIIANEWFDRDAGDTVTAVENNRYSRLPPLVEEPANEKVAENGDDKESARKKGVAPLRLLAPTLADALKDGTDGKAKVVSLSFKDRSAVLPGGLKPDACYWFDGVDGIFVTSTYYRDRPHDWVDEFNKAKPADRWFGKDWTKSQPDLDYEKFSGPDDVLGEGKGVLQGRTFPHAMTGGLKKPGKLYYQALFLSPFGNDLLLDLAERAIDAEKLGAGDHTDLLCISFSCNDAAGHMWGPDSQEVLDVTLRSDKIVKELLRHLDAKVGKGKYIVAISADHGVCPLPEVSHDQGKDSGRVDLVLLNKKASTFLDEQYGEAEGKDRWFEKGGVTAGYLNRALLEKRGLEQGDVEQVLADWLEKQPGIQKVYTRTQIIRGLPTEDPLGQAVLKSYLPDRNGDLMIIPKPYHLLWEKMYGTGHGTPHEYDTHVPLVIYGPGIKPGVYKDAITPLAAPVIMAKLLGIKPPAKAEAEVPEKLFGVPVP